MKSLLAWVFALLPLAAAAAAPFPAQDLHYRWIGPAVMGGRLDAVAGVAGDPRLIYLAHSSGGLWKSQDGGLTFVSAFAAGESSAVGAIALFPHDAQHLLIGTGEPFPRNTADYGDGLWESVDGGGHWRHRGFERSGSIAKIAVDPADPAVVLVAALGPEFAPGGQRGIYRSGDGGKHFRRVLYVNPTTGGSDLAFDPKDPNVVYAGTFDFLRSPWHMRSGGAGSGLYRSTDGGKRWTRLTDPRLRNGLPGSVSIDRVGVSVCASDPRVVYAFVPNAHGLLYRSTDGGKQWRLRNARTAIDLRPFYFSQVRCDPRDPREVYALGGALLRSTDGGKVFHDIGGGGDNHDLWIDPSDPRRLLDASDMGFDLSLDGGRTWDHDNVVPFAQVYRVGYDMDVPYHVMGGIQDHEVWRGPSELLSRIDGPGDGDWRNISDWGDGQYAAADPRDPAIVYEDTHFGDLARINLRTGERRYISPQPIVSFGGPASTYPYRFNWSAPLLVSHFNPDVIYFGGNVLFKSSDEGGSWSTISPDLTRCSAAQLGPSGGPVAHDNTNAETYCTIYTIGEDAQDPQTLWYGTDNGHLEITRNGGTSWSDVIGNVRGLPLPARVACVAPSATLPGTAYAAFDRHEWNDYRPYAYVTHDYGATWRRIGARLESYLHVVRDDPRNPNVLYAGTQRGIDVSFDGGTQWQDMRLGLPHLPVFDLQVQPRDNDLIVGTHGRGFYILDDLTPLQHWSRAARSPAYLFTPMPAIRYADGSYHEHGRGAFVSENKPYGALLTLYLAHALLQPHNGKPSVQVRILDAAGAQIDAFRVRVHAGLNRFTWDLHTQLPPGTPAAQDTRTYYVFVPMGINGPQVVPGSYLAQIALPGARLQVPVNVELDPHQSATPAQLHAQFDALQRLAVLQARAEAAIARLRTVPQGQALRDRLRNPDPSGYRLPAQLSEQIAYLRYTIAQYDGPPTAAQQALMQQYDDEMTAIESRMRGAHR